MRVAAYTDAVSVAGAEIVLGTLIGALSPGVDVSVVAIHPAVGAAIAAHRPGCAVHLVADRSGPRDLRPLPAHVRLLRRLAPDVLHVNQTHLTSCGMGVLAGILSRGPAVVAVEHVPRAEHLPARLRAQRRLLHRGLAAHVAVGERTAREVEAQLGLPSGAVLGLANGVPVAPAAAVARPVAGPLVAAAGRLTEQKGFDTLVRALAELPGASVLLVGDGPVRRPLEELAVSLGVQDRLHITGWRADARALVATADVLAAPSRWEGMPLVVLEAMMDGLPVVAADVGSVGDALRDGRTGFLVAPDDPVALAARVRTILDDPELAARLGAEGARVARASFTAAAMAARYETLWATLRPSA